MNMIKLSSEYILETVWRYRDTAIQKIQSDTNISTKIIDLSLQKNAELGYLDLEFMSLTDKGKQYLQYVKFSNLIHHTINAGMLKCEIARLGKKNFSFKEIKKLLKESNDAIIKGCPNKGIKKLYQDIFKEKS